MTSLIIGDKVKTIPAYLACDQTKLTSITIPNSVTSIEQYAFSGCSGLTSVEYNAVNCSSPSSSSYTWFKDCPLTSLIIGDEVETIPDYFAYNQNNLTSITIPDFVTFIGSSAFYGCTGLTSVTIGNSVTSIGEGAFSECTGLTSVEYNAINCADPTAYSYAWFKNSTLTSLKIGDKVKRIPAYLAFNQKNLSGITIPDSVTFIGSSAFYGCTGLKSITIPNSVTSIGNEAFYECSGLTSIKVDAGNAYYDSRNNCNAIIETKSNSLIKGCMNTIIPNSVTSIGSSAFNYCSGLTSINIPNSVTSIGEWAFSECSGLTSVAIPNSVTYIGDGAFSNCSELLDIYTKYMDPIAIPSSTFEGNTYTNTYTTAILHVPEGCIQYYRAKDYWNKFSIIRDDNGKPGDAVTGDLNDDGVVDIADVNAVIDMILGLQDATTVGDVNGDGNVDVADMNAIINIILGL
ncbi:MAG: leucine-rich repeat protein [Bacteroidales bacterium]|nr:leucine-rich repeat protein [Candidatus Sodaliphilus fimicaballi]